MSVYETKLPQDSPQIHKGRIAEDEVAAIVRGLEQAVALGCVDSIIGKIIGRLKLVHDSLKWNREFQTEQPNTAIHVEIADCSMSGKPSEKPGFYTVAMQTDPGQIVKLRLGDDARKALRDVLTVGGECESLEIAEQAFRLTNETFDKFCDEADLHGYVSRIDLAKALTAIGIKVEYVDG